MDLWHVKTHMMLGASKSSNQVYVEHVVHLSRILFGECLLCAVFLGVLL